MSTVQVMPAVKTKPSPTPRTSRAKISPGTSSGRKYSAPAHEAVSIPATITSRRPRRSAIRPARGRLTIALTAKAPTTMPTATGPESSGPVT